MTQHYLETMFTPSAIAVFGASDRHNSVGTKVLKNLLTGNYQGQIYAINPKHTHVQGLTCHPSIKQIKESIDLAIIATPARFVPEIIKQCGENGIHAAIVLSSGFSETGTIDGKALEKELLENARLHKIRLIGPNCLGVMRPSIMMNATFDNNFALPGSLALVSQSGAISASILDWAMPRKIGFSTIVSMGNNADIDFGDIIDYLALDPNTESILLYIEGIKNPKHFMSSLRAAARIKPVIAIKAGKNSQGSRAALSHTGALIGSDEVFDAALRRGGAIRVMSIEDLFSASEILTTPKKIAGNRLAIITNGGGAGVLAADRASELNVTLPILTNSLITELNQVLPTQWSHQNPIDIIGDATPERYHSTLDICNRSDDFDAILTILVPVSMSDPQKVAKQIIKYAKKCKKLIFVCWMGEKQVRSSWKLFAKHHIPYFNTPEKAIEAFSYLADYHHNQQLLMQAPDKLMPSNKPELKSAVSIINSVLTQNRTVLTASETKKILTIFGIPVIESVPVNSVTAATTAANKLGFPVVMKINSPDISHKAQAGGVCLNIQNNTELSEAYERILHDVSTHYPTANLLGVTIEPQYKNVFDREIMVGILRDIVFGPIISFGTGGGLVELLNDKALSLPPLNHFIIKQLIRTANILKPAGILHALSTAQMDGIISILLAVSEIACELPQIQEMDINPFILTETGMIAVDARMVVSR